MSNGSEKVSFTSGQGKPAEGALALPAGDGRAPGLVVLQEWWGLNAQIKKMGERFAAEGFVALVPDLYHGKVAADPTEAAGLMNSLDWGQAIDDIAGAVAFLRAHPRCNGKVAVTGFCMGGALTFATACNVKGLAAAVPFYGVPGEVPWGNVEAPIQAHFASRDDWAKPDAARGIQQTLAGLGKSMDLHVYEADHAFMNDARPDVFSPQASSEAWARAVAFLRSHAA